MKRLYILLVIALFLLPGCAIETTTYGYADWDADGDDLLTPDEFYVGYDDMGYYDVWDTDDDDYIGEEEWTAAIEAYYPTYDYNVHGDYDVWDMDRDGFIDDDEFYESSFTIWDENDDGFIDDDEYNRWYYTL